MRNFVIFAFLLTGLSELGIYIVFNNLMGSGVHPVAYFFPLFLFGIFVVVHWQLSLALKKDPKRFVTTFMGATGAKLLISMFMILILSVVIGDAFKPAAIAFVAIYFPFMALEVVFILKALKNTPGSQN